MTIPQLILFCVVSVAVLAYTIYWTERYHANLPGVLQAWAKANNLIVLRRRRAILPLRLRRGLGLRLGRPSGTNWQTLVNLEVLDETTRCVRRVWLYVRPERNLTIDDVKVIGWDDDR